MPKMRRRAEVSESNNEPVNEERKVIQHTFFQIRELCNTNVWLVRNVYKCSLHYYNNSILLIVYWIIMGKLI